MNVGIVGIGFMGMIHFLSYQRIRGAKVSAICEAIPHRRAGDWRDIQGNFGPAGTRVDLSGIATYASIDEFLADPRVDLVDVCLPPALHADTTIRALRAGKPVFCEKPMALTVADARRMSAAAEKARKLLLIGHVLPLFPEYRWAYRAIVRGDYGELLGGHFHRVISDPAWLPRYYDPDWIGGPMLDLHIHDAHFIRLLFGVPQAVHAVGRMRGDVAEYFDTQFFFSRPYLVTATGGVIAQPGRPFLHGFEIHCELATLVFEFGVLGGSPRAIMPLTVIPVKGKPKTPKLGDGDPMLAFHTELTEVIRANRMGTCPEFLSHGLACDAIRITHAETQSIRTGSKVRVAV